MAKKHFTTTQIEEGLYKLTPDKNYQLINKLSKRVYSEVTCFEENLKNYEVIRK